MNQFGNFLYELRKEKGLTQTALADKLNVTNKAVSKWETGEAFPETAQLVPIANMFNITVDELLRGQKTGLETQNYKAIKPFSFSQIMTITSGIVLILLGLIALVTLETLNYQKTGIFVLLTSIAVAVIMFNLTGFARRLKSAELSEENYKRGILFGLLISIGVALCIITPGLFIFMGNFPEVSQTVKFVISLTIIIIALMLIIPSATMWSNFAKQHYIPSSDGEEQLPNKAKNLIDAICGTIMLIATAIYLIIGFLFAAWHPGWVVFPIGGLLCAIASTIILGIYKK